MATSTTSSVLDIAFGKFEWPKDALLYCNSPERETLPDKARRLIFQSYLRFCSLPYSDKIVLNADYMSPSKKSPFLVINFGSKPVIFDDIFHLAKFLDSQNLGLNKELDKKEQADCEAFVSLVKSTIFPAIEYETWVSHTSIKDTLNRYGYSLPWPLSYLVPYREYFRHIWDHWDMHWINEDKIRDKFNDGCQSLSLRLGGNRCFFQTSPTILDAVVYGCLEAVLTSDIPLGDVLKQHVNLSNFCQSALLSQRTGLQFITSPSSANLASKTS